MSKSILFTLGILGIMVVPGYVLATGSFLNSGSYIVTFKGNPKIQVISSHVDDEMKGKGGFVLRCEDAQCISEYVRQEIPDECSVLVKNDVSKRGVSEIRVNTHNDMYYPVWYLLDSAENTVLLVVEFKNQHVLKKLREAGKPTLYYS